jgi:hypothetical protein
VNVTSSVGRYSVRPETHASGCRGLLAGDARRRALIFPGSRWEYQASVLLVCVAVVSASLLLEPGRSGISVFGFKWPVRCFLYETFGVKCALCGLTRSVCSLAHGQFSASLKFHPVGAAVFAFICFQIPYRVHAIVIYPRKVDGRLTKSSLGLAAILLLAIFVNWLVYLGGLVL